MCNLSVFRATFSLPPAGSEFGRYSRGRVGSRELRKWGPRKIAHLQPPGSNIMMIDHNDVADSSVLNLSSIIVLLFGSRGLIKCGLVIAFILSLMNMNALVYLIPVFLIESPIFVFLQTKMM